MSVTYTATLPVREETVALLADLLEAERLRRGTRTGTRALTTHDQAVLVLRWFCDGTRMSQLAGDNSISESTGYNYLHEGIDVLAARAPGLHGALLAAKAAGYSHVTIDGTLIETDRVSPRPDTRRGPVVVRQTRPARRQRPSHYRTGRLADLDLRRATRPGTRHHRGPHAREVLPALVRAADDLRALGDLGYEGEADTITVAFKKPRDGRLTLHQQLLNQAHNRVRAMAERGNALLKGTFKALRNISLCPWRIGAIVAAALVLLHINHDRTT